MLFFSLLQLNARVSLAELVCRKCGTCIIFFYVNSIIKTSLRLGFKLYCQSTTVIGTFLRDQYNVQKNTNLVQSQR